MTIINEPFVGITLSGASQLVPNQEQRVLLVAMHLDTGTSTEGVLYERIDNNGEESILFKNGSSAALGVQAFKKVAPNVRLDVIPYDEPTVGAMPLTATITFVGTSANADTFAVELGSGSDFRYILNVSNGTAAADLVADLVAQVTADDFCPFSVVDSGGGIATVTAKSTGLWTDNLGLAVTGGRRTTVTAALAITQAGAGTEAIPSTILDPVVGEKYAAIIWDSHTTTLATDFADAHEDADNAITDTIVVVTKTGQAFVDIDDFVGTGVELDTLNDKNLVYFADKWTSSGNTQKSSLNEPEIVKSAAFTAIRSKRLKPLESISRIVATNATGDQFGGPALASLPYANSVLNGFARADNSIGWSSADLTSLNAQGGSAMGSNPFGTFTIVGRVLTTYKTNAGGQPDITWKYLNYLDTSRGIREFNFNNIKLQYAQSRLTSGNPQVGRDQVDDVAIESFVDSLYLTLAGPDYVLTQKSDEAITFFKSNRNAVLDLTTGTVAITAEVPIVVQLRNVLYSMQIAFEVAA